MKKGLRLAIGLFVFRLTAGDAFSLVKDTSPSPDVIGIAKGGTPIKPTEQASVCVIGGGVSGLTAAITAAAENDGAKIVLLEACDRVGGRVQSDTTQDGYILDQGFAVFIEEYPWAKELLDYNKLSLGKFLPGALVKIPGKEKLVRVSDPLRKPLDLLTALFAPIGTIKDKVKLLPLIVNVRRKSIQALFEEPETDTLTALKERWGFSDEILDKFFRPFFEGIFLAPLEEQSSRMFSFVFKMLSEGSATLPLGGMAAVSKQLEEKAFERGVDARLGQSVSRLAQKQGGGYFVETQDGRTCVEADAVVVATDVKIAQLLMAQIEGFEMKATDLEVPQRSVGCLYYSFEGNAPVCDPILILNGEGKSRGTLWSPINNVCFPSSVNARFAPPGSGLCSVCVLKDAMDTYKDKEEELDMAVRKQLGAWFPEFTSDIRDNWKLKQIYYIPNAQPIQQGTYPATVNGGRDCGVFRGKKLPRNLFVCGDHMATSSLNGAFESGINAGKAAGRVVAAQVSSAGTV